ncbi:hypothetical protein SARC_05540 [Sphaeroforma arctica JP610]|uniref:Uncharacterized protein n=1 Tax=Sphaeroforma arctica JP610 TaxID=667725 RepID=A0A0L0FZY7_9EUKA|nr:hypothetical protein SARC_05540 [Sphaeroforma arctica JP610]KNC82159.1 hypothetical protein SARC_05540 [Sphaeroforma arctica JP610]|eukprot:XP_014156061.1 hypothetical protein SARC_05540 [Sphaeroforma arctica JP610]
MSIINRARGNVKCLSLRGARADLNLWDIREEQISNTKTKISVLPEELTHNVLVPVGKLAFMKGRLEHTNELMVLLGMNTLVKMSAKEAAAVLERRLEYTASKRSKIDQTVQNLSARLEMSYAEFDPDRGMDEDGNPIFEINEPYLSEDEMEAAGAAVKENPVTEIVESDSSEEVKDSEFADEVNMEMEEYWAAIERLQELEDLNNELALSDEDEYENTDTLEISEAGKVGEGGEGLDRLLQDSINDLEIEDRTAKLAQKEQVAPARNIQVPNLAEPTTVKKSDLQAQGKPTGTAAAFNGDVLEREPVPNSYGACVQSEASAKKISKFKAMRMGKQT